MADDWVDGEWIRQRLLESGKSQRELALALKIDPAGVSRLLDGRRKLRADEVPTIRSFFDGPPMPEVESAAPTSRPGRRGPEDDPRRRRATPGPRPRTRLSADIPVFVPIPAGPPYLFDLPGGPTEYRPCPPQLIGVAGGFGLFVPNDSLSPRVRAGELMYIHPHKPPAIGSDVCVRLRSAPGRIALLRHLGADEDAVRFTTMTNLRPGRPEEPLTIGRDEIAQIGRIVLIATE
jgi:hypothetical protein